MNADKVDQYLLTNSKYFRQEKLPFLREHLLDMPDEKWTLLSTLQMKDPTTLLIISLFLGELGIDRFMIGDTALGIIKLLTCGGAGIWAIIDWFIIMGKTRDKNLDRIMSIL